ncbi:rhodanese-like domain-containing protein [Capnocytophaga sp. ARDL2]|uniref:rhodanese-like domain-containing protein n=1 Tax=Capnocytophaga sp. ARDL2 TaxID=3238809 RepID=UPI0035581FB6
MKKILITLCIGLGISINSNAQCLKKVVNDENTLLVDVRTPEEFEEETAKNAINIPVDELENRVSELVDAKRIVVFCKSGKRAKQAKKILKRQKGIRKVYNGKTYEKVRNLQ